MSYPCCDMCVYWLSELKECGNTHIEVCMDKEYFIKSKRNCGVCEREIYNEAIDDFEKALCMNETIDKSVVRRVSIQLQKGGAE